MSKKDIIELIEKTLIDKMSIDSNYIRYTFYELRVKYNLSEQDTDIFISLIQNKLQNKGYEVYFTGERFIYQETNILVQPNELIIAVNKEKADFKK